VADFGFWNFWVDFVLTNESPLKREKRTQSGHRSGDRS
jgi:hypothetical protein